VGIRRHVGTFEPERGGWVIVVPFDCVYVSTDAPSRVCAIRGWKHGPELYQVLILIKAQSYWRLARGVCCYSRGWWLDINSIFFFCQLCAR